jgi:uncharacterized phage infection (PIP) family protein YhgE
MTGRGKITSQNKVITRSNSATDTELILEGSVAGQIAEISANLPDIADPTIVSLNSAIREILVTLQNVAKTLADQARTLTDQAQTHKNLLEQIKLQDTRVELLLTQVSDCKEECRQVREENIELNSKINDFEQYSKNYNVEVQGVPFEQGEDTYDIVCRIATALDCNIDNSDIEYCHRMRSNKRTPLKPPTIIAKFYSRQSVQSIIEKKKKKRSLTAKDIGFQHSENHVHINEHLTKHNKNLYWLARTFKKQANYKFAWTRAGRIFLRKDEQSDVIFIRKEGDIPIASRPN